MSVDHDALGSRWVKDLEATQRVADALDLDALPPGYTTRVQLPRYIDLVAPDGSQSVIWNRRGAPGWWHGTDRYRTAQAAVDAVAARLAEAVAGE